MLRGRIGAHVTLSRPDGRIESDVAATLAGNLYLASTRVDLPVEALGVLPVGLPKGWRGQLHADLAELELARGWPALVRGTIDMDGLIAPPPRNASIGSYHALLPDPKAQQSPEPASAARVTDKEGPFAVDGRLTLRRTAASCSKVRLRREATRRPRCDGRWNCSDRRTRRDVASSA